MVGQSSNVTGNEAGANRSLTGDQYLGSDPLPEGRPATKVGLSETLAGTGVTGTLVGRSSAVTGDEFGSCHRVTGNQYLRVLNSSLRSVVPNKKHKLPKWASASPTKIWW